MADRSDDRNGKFTLFTTPYSGARSADFKIFERNLAASAAGQYLHEDDYSTWQAMIDTDQGGQDPNADAMPAQGQAGRANAVRKRLKRQNNAFSVVFRRRPRASSTTKQP